MLKHSSLPMNNTIEGLQVYKAMICFLDAYYNKTLSDDLGSLLGDLQLCDDGGPFDPAAWDDWMRSLGTDKPVTMLDAFRAMISFLNDYNERTSSVDIKDLLNSMQRREEGKDMAVLWNIWINSVDEVVKK